MARISALAFLLVSGLALAVNARVPGAGPASSFTSSARSTASKPRSSASDTKYFFTFGDSYSQTGFNASGTQPGPGNPLGNPALPGWTSSGGLNWVGFMVTDFAPSAATYSYNFAYGGATTDAALVEPYTSSVLSFVDQAAEFAQSYASKQEPAWDAENALFGVWMGVNDVGNSFQLPGLEELIPRVVGRYFELVQGLYDAGARKFVLLTIPPTQKTPLMIALSADLNARLEAAIAQYNALLVENLAAFEARNPGVESWVVDTAPPFEEAIGNPAAYGAPDATCYNADGVSCLWHDDYHPGVQIQRLVAGAVAETVGAPWF